jgi:hypothetical protein
LDLFIALSIKHTKGRHEMKQHSITPEGRHTLLASNQDVLLFDNALSSETAANEDGGLNGRVILITRNF